MPVPRRSRAGSAEIALVALLRRWFPHLALIALAIWLLLLLEYGSAGRGELAALQARVAAQQVENARLELRNAALAAEVAGLKSGEAAVEERARAELGMIQPGETFYRVVETPE